MRIRAWVRAYFGFSKSETNGFLVLMPLTLVILFWEPLSSAWPDGTDQGFKEDIRKLDSLVATLEWPPQLRPDSVFPFDPNKADSGTWAKLGLSTHLSQRILSYRSRGGKFRKPDDLLRIYGMDTSWFDHIKGSVFIASKKPGPQKSKKPSLIDLNLADSLQLLEIRGIGPVLSRRIRVYRQKLGGFIAMQQLTEVYGLDSLVRNEMTARFFIAQEFQPEQININDVGLDDLSRHPYFRWQQAKSIILYRFQHGHFETEEDLKEVRGITDDWIRKVKPYLKFH